MKNSMKQIMLSVLFTFVIFFGANESHAFLGFSNTTVKLSYACLGLDGVPITDPTLAGTCCSGNHLVANPPATCATSLYGAGISEATAGTGTGITTAQSALSAANDLNGASTSYAGASPSPSSGTTAVSSADVAGNSTGNPSGTDESGGNGAGMGAGAGASGGSGGGGGGGSGDDALGTAGGTGANVVAGSTTDAGEGADGGAYGKSAGGGPNGANKPTGGLYGSLFGNKNGGANGAGMQDGSFGANGGGSGVDGSGAGADGKDGLGDGTTTDPEDYFSRIDKSANIFKVVSNRYAKETERKHLGIGIAKITQ